MIFIGARVGGIGLGIYGMVAIFGVAWMGSTFFEGHHQAILGSVEGVFGNYPVLFVIPMFIFSI